MRNSSALRRLRRVGACGVAGLAAATVCACGTGGAPGQGGGLAQGSTRPPAVGSVPSLDPASGSMALPLDAYYPTATQYADFTNVMNQLVSRCVKQHGFNYPVVIHQPMSYASVPGRGHFYDFGVTSMRFAATYGYHNRIPESHPTTSTGQPLPKSLNMSKAEGVALSACGASISRRTGWASNWSDLVQNLGIATWQQSESDARVLDLFRKWSACMARQGYHYANPAQAAAGAPGNSKRPTQWLTAAPTKAEIQTAMADVGCKQQSDLVSKWAAVLVAYQHAAISKDIFTLRANMQKFWSIFHKEEQLLASG